MGPWIVYKTTNIITGKYYYGVHNNKKSNYLGSGLLLRKAIKKYGKINFKRTVVKKFLTAEKAYKFEAELVNQNLVENSQCYNLALGGKGGNIHSKESIEKIRKAVLNTPKESKERRRLANLGRKHSEATKEKIRNKLLGRTLPIEVKIKIGKSLKKFLKKNKRPETSIETRNKIRKSLEIYRNAKRIQI